MRLQSESRLMVCVQICEDVRARLALASEFTKCTRKCMEVCQALPGVVVSSDALEDLSTNVVICLQCYFTCMHTSFESDLALIAM